MKFEDDYTEYKMLYNLSKSSYVPRTSWTTSKEFLESYPTVENTFTLTNWQAYLGSNQERRNQNPL